MDGRLRDDGVVVAGDARQRFHDARGYGRPLGGQEVLLSRVEAAHLLFRGDVDAVDGLDFQGFLAFAAGDGPGVGTSTDGDFVARFLVYADLRDRGFYLSPVRDGHPARPAGRAGRPAESDADFVVYPRGKGPGDGEVLYRIRVVGERASVPATDLGDVVLAVVDEESELTYFETTRPSLDGGSTFDLPTDVEGSLVGDRVVAWSPPDGLYERGFFGQPLSGRSVDSGAIQLSLVEAAFLAVDGELTLSEADDADPDALAVGSGDPTATIVERGRAVEGDRFDRRLRVYRVLRERDLVPKTGFKFGADFRVYGDFESVEDVGHSEWLVRVLPVDWMFSPRDLALDVRLAHGVRKRMVFALVDDGDIADDGSPTWFEAGRLTP